MKIYGVISICRKLIITKGNNISYTRMAGKMKTVKKLTTVKYTRDSS